MANFNTFIPKVLKLEGNFVDDPDDRGKATNKGITIATFKAYYGQDKTVEDLKNITVAQASKIYKERYWDVCKGDYIKSQSVAELLVDMAINSGTKVAIIKIQRLVGVKDDGVFGNETLRAVNAKNPQVLFNEIHDVRVAYYKAIVAKRPANQKFLHGWCSRVNSYKFEQ